MSRRRVGSFSFSSGVNLLSTKSTSEILPAEGLSEEVARLEPTREALSVPMRSLGKSLVPSFSMVDFKPLFPPAEPEVRSLVLPKSRLKSSQTIKILELSIL